MNKPRIDAPSEKSTGSDHEDHLMLIGADGRVAFTPEGRRELAPYFALAGINLATIKTRRQYLEARRAASPYFLGYLHDRFAGKPNTLEYNALRAIIDGDDETFDRLFHRITIRNQLHTV